MGWAERQKKASVGPIHHAPWLRKFKTFYCNGSFAHEVQIGPVVFYLYHNDYRNRWLKVTTDPFWRR